ncbi:MAG TPA: calcium:proton antiporter [Acidobacteriota bacterium]|nr:calcium:proton antiporter [Acidobacteriota bacterium]
MQKRTLRLIRNEWALLASVLTSVLFLLFGDAWMENLSNVIWFSILLIWLFTVILFSAFAIVRHAESLAIILGEPLGTLILTLSVIGVEVLMISAVMLTGEGKPAIARDTMFSVVMILLGGMTGVSLLLGGMRHREQTYNLQGANAYLALIIPLSILGLVLPNYTTTTSGPTLSPFQSVFTSLMSVSIYGVFLAVQTSRHREYFVSPDPESNDHLHGDYKAESTSYHSIFLVLYILPLIILAKELAIPLEYGTSVLNAPKALSGMLVAILILSPEAMSAVRAAVRNQLQRSVNILLGSVLATIGLTIPAVLIIGLITGKTIYLGLEVVNTILLVTLLVLSMITFSNIRTNVLLGAVHLLLFLAYLMLMFEG